MNINNNIFFKCVQTWSRYIMIFGGSFLFSSWRDFRPYLEPLHEEDKKVTKASTLTLTRGVSLPSCLQLRVANLRCFSTHRLHFTAPALGILIRVCLEDWIGIKVLEAWAGEPVKRAERSAAIPAQRKA